MRSQPQHGTIFVVTLLATALQFTQRILRANASVCSFIMCASSTPNGFTALATSHIKPSEPATYICKPMRIFGIIFLIQSEGLLQT
jgi:hypothetical protein